MAVPQSVPNQRRVDRYDQRPILTAQRARVAQADGNLLLAHRLSQFIQYSGPGLCRIGVYSAGIGGHFAGTRRPISRPNAAIYACKQSRSTWRRVRRKVDSLGTRGSSSPRARKTKGACACIRSATPRTTFRPHSTAHPTISSRCYHLNCCPCFPRGSGIIRKCAASVLSSRRAIELPPACCPLSERRQDCTQWLFFLAPP